MSAASRHPVVLHSHTQIYLILRLVPWLYGRNENLADWRLRESRTHLAYTLPTHGHGHNSGINFME